MLKRFKRWTAQKLFKLLKPIYQTLEKFLKEEIRTELQAEQYRLAELKIEFLHNRRRLGISKWPRHFDSNPDTCNHMKGGNRLPYFPRYDYAVRQHTFPNGETTIACLVCGKTWTKDSPDWAGAQQMMLHSSNTPTTSEHLIVEKD